MLPADIHKRISEAQSNIPVQIVNLCNELGIRVYEVKQGQSSMSGMIKKEQHGYCIYINASHPKTRRRFTVAHELAHWILHRDLIGDGVVDDGLYRSGLPTQVEVEANRLAADLLMPKQMVESAWKDPNCDLACIAEIFEVSKSAMAIRLGIPLDHNQDA